MNNSSEVIERLYRALSLYTDYMSTPLSTDLSDIEAWIQRTRDVASARDIALQTYKEWKNEPT